MCQQRCQCKTYWKPWFNYELKLHGGQNDRHEAVYHWYAPYCRSEFFVCLKDHIWQTNMLTNWFYDKVDGHHKRVYWASDLTFQNT